MSLRNALLARIPSSVKDAIRARIPRLHLEQLLAPHLPEMLCIDVGASYYPHPAWQLLRQSPATRWIAVEPNVANLGYVQSWSWPSRVTTCTTGLSEEGGAQTLHVTNVDSGSSLLPPEIPASQTHRFPDRGYFFPVREVAIVTKRLPDLIAEQPGEAPIVVKLDTQGTELSILRAADALLRSGRIVGIELESTLLAQPVMKGSGKLWEAISYLEERGFELMFMKPIEGPSRLGLAEPRGRRFLNECDAVFTRRVELVAKDAVERRVALLAFFSCNQHYEEALHLLEADADVARALRASGCDTAALARCLRSLA